MGLQPIPTAITVASRALNSFQFQILIIPCKLNAAQHMNG